MEPLYLDTAHTHLSELNRLFLEAICDYLGIGTTIRNSWDYELGDGQTERLVSLCAQSGASEYVSGPAAKDYVDEQLFAKAGIALTWFDYEGYREYPQLWDGFVHRVSIVDLLFNCGPNASEYMRYVN